MVRFMKVSILANEYQEVKKIGGMYIVHLDGKNTTDDMIECYECTVNETPDLEALSEELTEWKNYISSIELVNIKEEKIKEVNEYDKSSSVNSFTYNGVEMWLDKTTRNGLLLRFNAEKLAGKTETTLWFGTQSFTLNIDNGIQLLYALEVYASECFDNTASHIAAVEAMTNIDDVKNYDHTQGYPAKLIINS